MCRKNKFFKKTIYGMPYEFYGFEDVEKYLPFPGGGIETLNSALDRWFHYFQMPAVTRPVKKVLVVNICDQNAQQIVRKRGNDGEIYMLDVIESNPILGQQANDIILINDSRVKEKANVDREVFFAVLLHESTHLLEQYLAGSLGIYNSLEVEGRAAYHAAVSLSKKEGRGFAYLNEVAEYQSGNMDSEALTCLVEALTFYQLKELHQNSTEAPYRDIIEELQGKLCGVIKIAQGRGVLPMSK